MEVWKEKNTNANTSRSGESVTKSVYLRWRENAIMLRLMSKRLVRLLLTKQDDKGYGLRLSNIMAASVLVVGSQR